MHEDVCHYGVSKGGLQTWDLLPVESSEIHPGIPSNLLLCAIECKFCACIIYFISQALEKFFCAQKLNKIACDSLCSMFTVSPTIGKLFPHTECHSGRDSCSRLVFHLQYLLLAGSFPLENAARRSAQRFSSGCPGEECIKSIYCTVSHCFCRKFCTPDVGVLSILGIFRFLERSYMVMW